jgi:hypothetical protein
MIGEARFHGGGDPEGLMQAGEVVSQEIEGERMAMVFQLLRERICEPCKPAERHARSEIVPLDIAGGNVFPGGSPLDRLRLHPAILRRTVARLAFRRRAVELNQRGVIDPCPERVLHGFQIHAVAIRGQLYSGGETTLQIGDERAGRVAVAIPD